MNPAAVLARGRAAAEALMVDTCAIRRRTGETLDDTTGEVTATYDDVYSGRCRVQQAGTQTSTSVRQPVRGWQTGNR